MQSANYTDLYALILALSGNDSFTTNEQTKILALANRRLYQAYRASDNWARYQRCEARPGFNSLIEREYTVAAVTGSAVTRSGTTVTFVATTTPTFTNGMYVVVAGLSGSVDPNGTYQLTSFDEDTNTFTYELASGTGNETYTGTGTATPSAVDDIDTAFRVWSANPVSINSANEYEFWADNDGYRVVANTTEGVSFWVAYKAVWDGPYVATATTLPYEWFYYAAHATYADYLRADGQVDKALAEEGVANNYLVTEIDRAENQRNANIFKRRISTYNSRQAR